MDTERTATGYGPGHRETALSLLTTTHTATEPAVDGGSVFFRIITPTTHTHIYAEVI